ncbi:HNH endonuclease [Novosphingobium sp. 1949]|uniref:HNH endonuclease n=1 Tax=Novosphingobium organovorum TaxID=2930092 RepID=A0ABT0B8E7_9SPHN|nr:HNH endonuclease [Novosphingobium organovorum]MCJ2181194.1 HNH endonuclease [Novosphingobium organovorum]
MPISQAMEDLAQIPCWLCGRALGRRIEWHHPVPKSRGGRTTEPVHRICHRTLHASFANAELARIGGDVARLRERVEIARFLAWIADKPADFHAPTRKRR